LSRRLDDRGSLAPPAVALGVADRDGGLAVLADRHGDGAIDFAIAAITDADLDVAVS
jgi:hypothetical protein